MKESMVSLLISGGIVAGGFIAAILSAVLDSDALFQLGSTAVVAGIGFFMGMRAGTGNGKAARNGD